MKTCKACLIEKELSEFPVLNKQLGTYRTRCHTCYRELRKEQRNADLKRRKESNKKSYERNKVERIKKVRLYQKNNPEKRKHWSKTCIKKLKDEFVQWKSTLKCANCEENHISCLEFHHLDPSQKDGLITKMRTSRNKLKEELKKCIVLCSNCHRKLHYEQNLKLQHNV